MDANEVLEYQARPVGNSRWAIGIFVASIVAAGAFFLIVPSVLTFIAAVIVSSILKRQIRVGGHGFAGAAITISGCGILAGLVAAFLMPSVGGVRCCLGPRVTCGSNLRGIAQSMAVYSADNSDSFPIIAFAPYASVPNSPAGKAGAKIDDALKSLYDPASQQAGSVQGCMWVLVLAGAVSPRQFMCRQDPFVDYSNAAVVTDPRGNYYDNFQKGNQLSYSMAYPWNGDGKPGAWWNSNSADSELPILADMAPKQGTGMPARNLIPAAAPAANKTWNSSNHGGDGQNVAYGDCHAEFQRRPDVGQKNDNIYSMSGSPSMGPAQFGGIPAGFSAPNLRADKPPYDIIMLPVRDETTGGM